MQQINITVADKKAMTDFDEVVTRNGNYRLKFSFDEEWEAFPVRIAVAAWEDGCAEQSFEGDECNLPYIFGDVQTVLVGVYSVNDGVRLSSSYVRLRCLAGANGTPSVPPQDTVVEQILARLNSHDWTIFSDKMEKGTYSALKVNAKGVAVEGKQSFELSECQTPSVNLMEGGLFFQKTGASYAPFVFQDGALSPLNFAGTLKNPLQIGENQFDGSEKLALSAVALSGSYNDLKDCPQSLGGVQSVNGKTGEVMLDKSDVGLEKLTGDRQMPLAQYVVYGADYSEYLTTGFTEMYGSADYPTKNAPTSESNPSQQNGDWMLLVMSHGATNFITQLAFSVRGDCAVRIRNKTAGNWTDWQAVFH